MSVWGLLPNGCPTSEESWLATAMNCLAQNPLLDLSAPDADQQDVEDEIFAESESDCFHATDSEQEEIFHSSESGPEAEKGVSSTKRNAQPRRVEKYEILGKEVCASAFARLLGVGSSTLTRIRQGQPAFTKQKRPPLPKHPQFKFALRGEDAALWEGVVMFLWCLYHSKAEIMPTNFTLPGRQKFETPFPENEEQDSELVERLVQSFSRSLQSKGTDVNVNMVGPGTFMGPLRALPHGSRAELYWEYVAFNDERNLKGASYYGPP